MWEIHNLKYIGFIHKGEKMNNNERDEKFLKSWLKKKISITTSTVVSFLITGAAGGGVAYGVVNERGRYSGTNPVSWGRGANATHGSVAIGENAKAITPNTPDKGATAVAVGVESNTNSFGVAIGFKAGADSYFKDINSNSNITIGANTKVGVQGSGNSVGQSIAIGSSQGNGAWAKGTQAIAIGADTIAEGNSSIAIGGDDINIAADSTKSYVKKSYDKNGTETSTTVNNQKLDDIYKDLTGRTEGLKGYRGTKAGEASVALGVKAEAGDIATALGTMSEATGINSLALGTGARATQVNSVAIGGGSTTEGLQGRKITDANIVLSDGTNVNFENFAGAAEVEEGDVVSFGRVRSERQLKHIAPGEISATSTDAINGSQLFSVARKLGSDISKLNTDISKFKYVSINSNDAGNKTNDGATANNAIAIGPNASTKVASAISLGDGANVTTGYGEGSGVAIGKKASAVQAGIAIGDTSSTVSSGIAIGREAKVNNKYETASAAHPAGTALDAYLNYDRVQNPDNLKYSNTETTDNKYFSPDRYNGQGIAIGYKAESNVFGTSLGNSAVAKQGGLALGTFSKATGATSTAIGLGANSSGARAISMGRQASATTDDSVAIGTGARGGSSSAGGSVAVGGGAAATGTQAIAIGGLYGNDLYSSSATKDGAGNLTKNTQASGEASIAMGVNTKAVGKQALAMGSDAQATSEASIAMGVNTKATAKQALAMGASAQAKSEAALAIGVNAVSDKGIAIGKNSTSGNYSSSIALGTNATSNVGGIAIGENATAQSKSIVIGSGTRTSGPGTVVIGDEAGIGSASGKSANGMNSVAIGKAAGKNSDAITKLYSTIAIGAHSKVGDVGKATVSQSIAIGGVADGQANNPTWARGDQSIAIGGDVKSLGDSSVAIGGDDLDAVGASSSSYEKKIFDKNGNQVGSTVTVSKNLNQIFSSLTGRGEILSLEGKNSIDGREYKRYQGTESGQGAVALGVKAKAGDIALAIGTMTEATGLNSVAIGTGAQTPQANAVAIGGGSTTVGTQGRQITDADVTLTDGTTMNYGGFAGATNVEEGSMVSFGRAGRERQLKNIAPGEISATSTDAINGSQLYSVAKTLGEGWKADAGGNKIGASTLTSVKPGNTVVYSAGSNLQVKQTIDATNGKQTYEYSLNKDLTGLDSVTTKKLTVPGTGGKDTVIDNNGINAGGNKISNVAAGTKDEDAVNKSQLDKIGDNKIKLGGNTGVTDPQKLSQDNGLKFNIVGANGIETSASGTDVTVKLDNATKSKIDKVAMPMRFAGDDYDSADEANTTIAKGLGERLEIVGKATDLAKGIPNVGTFKNSHGQLEIGLAKSLTGLQAAQFLSDPDNPDKGYSTITGDGYTITPVDAGGNVLPEISITKDGINAGNKTITNVAPGTKDEDAVNVSQLKTVRDNKIKLGGDNSSETKEQVLSQAGGLKFNIKGANGLVTEANGTDVTVKLDSVTKQKIDKAVYPLKFQGNNYDPFDEVNTVLSKELNQTVEIVGEGAKADSEYSGESVKTIVENGRLVVKLDKTLKTDNLATNKVSVGKDGTNGKDAVSISGTNGKDGAIGINGKDGASANITVQNGDPVLSGTAADRIFYKDSHGTDYQVATMADGLKFSGDDVATSPNNTISKKLNETLKIEGGVSDKTKLSDNNIGAIVDNTGKINVKLAKELTGLTSAEFKTAAGEKTVINGNGLTVTPSGTGVTPISVTKDGINAGNKIITNVAAGVNDKDAVNVSQLKEVRDNKIKLGGDKGTETKEQSLSQSTGIKFDIVGANGITTEAKDGKVTVSVDPSKLSAGNSKLSYTANGAAAKKEVTLTQGLDFTNGIFTEAEVDENGVVKYNAVTDSVTVDTDGKITGPTADGLVTAKDVASTLSGMGWKATAGVVSATEGTLEGTVDPTLVKSGDQVTFVAGKNLTVSQEIDTDGNHKYTYKLDKNLKDLESVTTKTITIPGATPGTDDVVIGKDGINAGNKPITNVTAGVNDKDAVNVSQLKEVRDNKIKLGGDNSSVTKEQVLSKTGGLQFNVVGTTDEIVTAASGDQVKVGLAQAVKDNIDSKANKDLSNLTPAGIDKIKDTAAWKVKANSNAAETVKGGDEVVFKDGAGVTITQNGKEFTIAADTSKISKDTKISYTANGAAPKKEVSLADGFNFEDGTLTTASVDTAGKVKYDVKTTTLTSTDGKVTVPTTDGVATAKDVANAINNSGWKANAGGNVDGTPASTLVKSGDEVVFKAGDNLTVKQDLSAGKQEYTYKLNKDLTGLDSVTTKTITIPGATGTNDVVIGKDGINAGNKPITNVADGVNGKDAVNKSQLDKIGDNEI